MKNITFLFTHHISITLFIISLPFNACLIEGNSANSFMLLISGWVGIIVGGANMVWLANPLVFISWILSTYRCYTFAAIFGFAASGFAFSFLFFHGLMTGEDMAIRPITSYLPGYWLWLLSCMSAFLSNVIFSFHKPKQTNIL